MLSLFWVKDESLIVCYSVPITAKVDVIVKGDVMKKLLAMLLAVATVGIATAAEKACSCGKDCGCATGKACICKTCKDCSACADKKGSCGNTESKTNCCEKAKACCPK